MLKHAHIYTHAHTRTHTHTHTHTHTTILALTWVSIQNRDINLQAHIKHGSHYGFVCEERALSLAHLILANGGFRRAEFCNMHSLLPKTYMKL